MPSFCTSFCTLLALACLSEYAAGAIVISSTPPVASVPIPESFVSYSIEFSSFPDFAGNTSSPNAFSDNLLSNLGHLAGSKPIIRVGGNTQDYYIYNASQSEALIGIVDPTRSPDYPTAITIGPSYFESYATFSDTKYVHGFNMGLGGNNSIGWQSLIDVVAPACNALSGGKLLAWEYGNEPDLFSTSAQGPVRSPSWNEPAYVAQWLNGTRAIEAQLAIACPELVGNATYGYLAPSFAGTANHLKYLPTWQDGLNTDGDIKLISSHNYIGGATQPGVTLQGTLMNHTKTVSSISSQIQEMKDLSPYNVPFILGETNSLYNQGAPGLSNSFGAALWNLDFQLWCASQGIQRVHMHMGTNYRYAAWQPISTNITSIGAKAPYYGNIASAAMLGDLAHSNTVIANLPLDNSFEAAYAAYTNGDIRRIAVVNMKQYNYTINGTENGPRNPVPRPYTTYEFQIPTTAAGRGFGGLVSVQRLWANGSDAVSGITFDGFSYNYELDEGNPVLLNNVTRNEWAVVEEGGLISVNVSDSSAVILNLWSAWNGGLGRRART